MGGPPGSQVAPLPSNLPFRLVSKTIGSGAYASIRKAVPHHRSGPVIAVKFINKEHAFRSGRLRPKQLALEVSLHKSVCPHDNIIKFLAHGDDNAWVWVCLELAEGGDLFDKIEADEGVGEDIAHLYFTQLVSAIDWCHGKGVAHRDVKPENMLLSGEGDLKLADFGLATQFLSPRTGERKSCGMVCGSPPYIASEILEVGRVNCKRKGEDKVGYDPQIADVWSCAIVLFVLLAGNTPWDSPVLGESYEFHDYVQSHGRPQDELWSKIPAEALSLIRGMLKVSTQERFTLSDVRKHPWFTRRNAQMNDQGKAANPLGLATQILESLHINFDAEVPASQQRTRGASADAMDIDDNHSRLQPGWHTLSATQPETPVTPITNSAFEWEAPPRPSSISASQPIPTTSTSAHTTLTQTLLLSHLACDASMSQFAPTPSVPISLTQAARHFNDILPSHSLARFLSALPLPQFLPLLLSALHRLNVPIATPPASALAGQDNVVSLRIKTVDARQQPLHGNVVVERIGVPGQVGLEVLEVRFLKAKGDPLGWRRFFKQVAVLCKDGLVVPQ